MKDLHEYIKSLGFSLPNPVNEQLLQMAFTHKSFSMDAPHDKIPHNERLEFLGDSVLGMIVADELYKMYPDVAESQLTLMKIQLDKEPTLATVARKINLGEHIRLGRGEDKTGGAQKDAILSDMLESLIGYLYIDQGRTTVASFVKTYIIAELALGEDGAVKSFKSLLQELVQQLHKDIPVYQDIELHVEPTGNVTLYGSDVFVNGVMVGHGE